MPTSADQGVVVAEDGTARCFWAGNDPLYRSYHDGEWGQPVVDERRLFEKLCLEGFQSGLSWLTILKKRENFRRAFREFELDAVARFNDKSVARLLTDAGIVRHRGKIESAINNAKRARDLRAEYGSLAAYFWTFEPDPRSRPRRVSRAWLMANPTSAESIALSKDLKRRGFSFVGPTTAYAFMQAMGLCNDHIEGCHARASVASARAAFEPPVAKGRSA